MNTINGKPDSVWLSLLKARPSFICPHGYPWGSICLPFPVSLTERSTSHSSPGYTVNGDTRTRDLRGISARKVYPPGTLLWRDVGSYPTFSPLPRRCGTVIFCGTVCSAKADPAIHRCDALCCPDFPHSRRKAMAGLWNTEEYT